MQPSSRPPHRAPFSTESGRFVNTRHLEYFLAVADCGGFNRAAEQLRVAQPSLSQAIRALERDLKVTLFVRTARHSVLTELEMQWGRTIGQLPSPVTAGNPLVAPYHLDQGP